MPDESHITIVVADDHALFRSGVAGVIHTQSDLKVIGEACDGEQTIDIVLQLRPDVVLLDLQMPRMEGADVVERIRDAWADARIVILTTYDFDEDIEKALRAGAKGYLLKDTSAAELIKCVRDVHAGRTCVAPAVAGKLALRMTRVNLTMREMQVLRLVADGKANKEIADALTISEGTVKLHLNNLFQKLDVQSRTEAVKVAMQRGLIRLPK